MNSITVYIPKLGNVLSLPTIFGKGQEGVLRIWGIPGSELFRGKNFPEGNGNPGLDTHLSLPLYFLQVSQRPSHNIINVCQHQSLTGRVRITKIGEWGRSEGLINSKKAKTTTGLVGWHSSRDKHEWGWIRKSSYLNYCPTSSKRAVTYIDSPTI